MIFTFFQTLLTHLLLPLTFIISLWRASFNSKLDWISQSLFTLMLVIWAFLAIPWDWSSYYLRFLWPLLLIPAVYSSWKKAKTLPFRIPFTLSQKLSIGFNIVLFLFFGGYTIYSLSGLTTKDTAIELEFPLKDGTYYVRQGGNSVSINYHNAYQSQQYAIDITKLNALGMRSTGIYPEKLNNYYIYGDKLYAPCAGLIVSARNDLPDSNPPKSDPKNASGNHVVIQCEQEEVEVLIAHMLEGSVAVTEGDRIKKGQPIGMIGNSGNTSEPHLHIHAEKDGKGVPIKFDGRFIVRNSLVW